MKDHMMKWGIVYILLALFLVSLVFQFYTQLDAVTQTAVTHGEVFLWADFWPQFMAAVFENWQSEFLQLMVQAWLVNSILQRWWFKADWSADKDDLQELHKKLDALLDKERPNPVE